MIQVPSHVTVTPMVAATAVGAVAIGLLLRRRRSLPRLTVACLAIAIVLLVLAAGSFVASLPRIGEVVVMVDCSPSTRSAIYRDRASLNDRLSQLLGRRAFKLVAFGEQTGPLPAGDRLADWPAQKTVFVPPAGADAIVLLSDGQFEPPANAPPTFPVIDGGLIDPADAAVVDARVRTDAGADQTSVATRTKPDRNDAGSPTAAEPPVAEITVTHRGNARSLRLDGAEAANITANGVFVNRLPLADSPRVVHRVELSPGDAWPENDAIAFASPAARALPRWWIGNTPAPAGWQPIAPSAVPSDAAEFLAPAVIALSNVSADDFSPATQTLLQQYVRDLGGSLLIFGGDHAFSLGGYSGSMLDDLSPLSSDPPTPTTQWLLLTDASGSMAGPANASPTNGVTNNTGGPTSGGPGPTRWTTATEALIAAIRELPPADSVSVGSFAADLRWWLRGVPVTEARTKSLPPADVSPNGPTNLQSALEKLVGQFTDDQPKNLIVLTDGEATLDHADTLAAAMAAKHVRLHVLAIGNGDALPALRSIATTTGGSYAAEVDASRWLAGVRSLVRGAMPDRAIAGPVTATFNNALANLPARSINKVNHTWLKSTASSLAVAQTPDGPMALAAQQQVGNGRVIACAFMPNESEFQAMAAMVARPPRNPRYRVDWSSANRGKVTIDAADAGKPVNDLSFVLQLTSLQGSPATLRFEQIGPGLYAAAIPPSAEPRLAKVMLDNRELDRLPLAGRYAPEFDAIGIDRAALESLAQRTGGRVIDPDVKTPIDLSKLWRRVSLTPWLAAAAAVLIATSLVHWKRATNGR